MNRPMEEKSAAKLTQAIRILARNEPEAFNIFMGWFASELQKRDEENRVIERANTTSEAQALAVIIETVAACLAPVADRDLQETGVEGTSAGSPT